jgi:hypothetical protein
MPLVVADLASWDGFDCGLRMFCALPGAVAFTMLLPGPNRPLAPWGRDDRLERASLSRREILWRAPIPEQTRTIA